MGDSKSSAQSKQSAHIYVVMQTKKDDGDLKLNVDGAFNTTNQEDGGSLFRYYKEEVLTYGQVQGGYHDLGC